MFAFLKQRWQDLFNAEFDVLLYDLTSTYFECDPPESGKRRYGYSRDKRSDCVQVAIALVVTTEGFPLCYEVMDGNTSARLKKTDTAAPLHTAIPRTEPQTDAKSANFDVKAALEAQRAKRVKFEHDPFATRINDLI
jgi:hypothetical protein